VKSVGASSLVTRASTAAFVEGMKMKHQVQYGTASGIVSEEAVEKTRILIAELTRTVHILTDVAAEEKRRPQAPNSMLTKMLDARCHNLIDTIACLEDRLGTIEHVRARDYGRANSELPCARAALPH
jgi:hypothetical protein